jgi:hypothetical protein
MKRLFALGALLFAVAVSALASSDFAFAPSGPTVLVDTTARQVVSTNSVPTTAYRIRNLGAAQAYFTWATPNNASGGTPTGLSATAPVAGTVAPNVIGMLPASVETFTFPSNAWFQAGVGFTFEVTPGEGR